MIWTYRVVRDEIGRYSVREVYQERDGTLITYSKTPVAPIGSSVEDLLHLYIRFVGTHKMYDEIDAETL